MHEKIATAFSCMTICAQPGSDRAIEMAIPILYYFIMYTNLVNHVFMSQNIYC